MSAEAFMDPFIDLPHPADMAEQSTLGIDGVRNGSWLDSQEFPPLRYAVPGLLPEGFTLLAGSPKVGKSWLVLDLLLAIASGSPALGVIPTRRPRSVLYLALEDGERRLQDRCRQLLGAAPIPAAFHFLTQCDPAGMQEAMRQWLDRHIEPAAIVLDTLGKAMPPASFGETTYQRDYRLGGAFKRLCAHRPGIAVIVVHHDRKSASEDFVETVSGTNGLAGAADTIMILNRERHSDEGLLKVTGRDVIEAEYALTRNGPSWVMAGNSVDAARDQADRVRSQLRMSSLGDRMQTIVEFVNSQAVAVSPAQVEQATGIDHARNLLGRAASLGLVDKASRGLYLPVHRANSASDATSIDAPKALLAHGIGGTQ